MSLPENAFSLVQTGAISPSGSWDPVSYRPVSAWRRPSAPAVIAA
jgi:hypothetical protein